MIRRRVTTVSLKSLKAASASPEAWIRSAYGTAPGALLWSLLLLPFVLLFVLSLLLVLLSLLSLCYFFVVVIIIMIMCCYHYYYYDVSQAHQKRPPPCDLASVRDGPAVSQALP